MANNNKDDVMTRDIRKTLRDSFSLTAKYTKSTAKLFLASGKDYFNLKMPVFNSFYETNQELLTNTHRSLRNPSDGVNSLVQKLNAGESIDALKDLSKDALEDLKSGKFYDKNRFRGDMFEDSFDSFDVDDDFGGFDLDGFDENGDWEEPDPQQTKEIKAQAKIAAHQENNANARAEATIGAIGTSTEAIVANDKAIAANNLRLSLKQHSQVMNSMQNIVTQQAATFELLNKNIQASLGVTREAHNQVMDRMKEITSLLTEIRDGVKPPQTDYKRSNRPESMFTMQGALDIKNFFKNISRNVSEKFPMVSMGGMLTSMLDANNLKMMYGSNPLKILTDLAFPYLLPKNFKKQLDRTGKNMSSFLPALFQKFGDRGRKFEEGEGTIMDMILGMLAPNERSRSSIKLARDDYLKQVPFTRKTATAIEEVIPMLLSKINSSIAGGPLVVYDYRNGKFKNAGKVIAESERSAHDLAGRSGEAYSMMMGRASQYKFKTTKESDEFKDYIHKYLQNAADKGIFINPYQSEDDFKRTMPDSSKQDLYYNLMMGMLKSMKKSDLQQMSRELLDARESRDNNADSLNESLRNSGLLAAWSGLMDPKLQKTITNKSRGARTDLTESDINKLTETRRNQIIKAGGPRATNIILNDVLNTLRKGIITYSYNMGKMDPKSVDGLSHAAQQVITNARALQAADTQKIKTQYRDQVNAAVRRRKEQLDAERSDNPSSYISEDISVEEAIGMFDNFQDILSDNTEMDDKIKKMNENYKNVADKVKDTVKGRRKNKGDKGSILSAPFTLMTKGLQVVDNLMIRVLYGKDAADAAKDGEKSFLDTISDTVKANFTKVTDWFKENVGNPLKNFLFDKENGFFKKIKAGLFEIFGINDIKKRATDNLRVFRDGLFAKLFGVKDDKGDRSGGIFSSTINKARGEKNNIGDMIKDSISRLLYGDYKSTKGVGADNYYQDQDGKFVPYGKKKFGGIIGKLKQGFSGLQTFLFGEDDENGNPSESRKKWNNMKGEFGKAFPNITIGAGLGALSSIFLPGGPVLGAIIGSTTGLVKGSDQLKDFLFGKEIVGKDGKPTREGKLISKEVYEGVKKFAPKTLKGALLGGVLGGLGILPLGLGSIAGSVMGAVGGMTSASDQVKKIIFGDNEDKDSGIISKNFREKVKGQLKKFAPGAMVGALAGSGAWSLISGIGLLPGLSMLPGGPVLGFLGAATGMANADKFNKLIFGTEEEEEVTDEETGEKKKVKKRKGGIFAGAENFVKDKLLTPFSKKFDDIGNKVSGWFQDNIVGSLKRMSEPLKKGLENAGKSIKESMINIGSKITDAFSNTVNEHVGKPLGEMFKEKFIDPLGKLADKILGGIGKVLGAIISAPFKFLEFMLTGKVGSATDDETELDENGLPKKSKNRIKLSERLQRRKEEREEARRKRKIAREQKRLDRLYQKRFGVQNKLSGRREAIQGTLSRGAGEAGLRYKILSTLQAKDSAKLSKLDDMIIKLRGTAGIEPVVDVNTTPSQETVDVTERAVATMQNAQLQGPQLGGADWEEYQRQTKGKGTAQGYGAWLKDHKAKQDKEKKSKDEKEKNKKSDKKRDTSTKKQDDKRDEVQEAKSDRDADNESTNRKKTTRSRRKRDDNSYLAEIAKNTKNIYREVKGQVNGVGWNTSYIRVLLAKQYGGLSNDELPEEMEGSTIKKRRGFIGKAADKAKDVFGGLFGGIIGKGKKVASGVKKVFEFITNPFKILISAVKGAGSALKAFGSGILGFLKTIGPVVAETLKQGIGLLGETLKGAVKVIAETAKQAISGVGAIIKNGVNMLGQLMGSALTLVRGVAEIAADIFPDIAHLVWSGVKGLGRGLVKGVKGIGKGIGAGVKKGVGAIAGKLTGKNNPDKVKTKVKKIGTFEISGGTLDTVKQTNTVKIGSPEASIFMPYVRVFKGRVRKPVPYAIPVYVAGSYHLPEVGHGDNVGSRLRGAGAPEIARDTSGNQLALPSPIPMNITGETTITTSDMRPFISTYRRVNTVIDASGDPTRAYDRLVRDAKTPSDIQAINLVNQLNGTAGGAGGSGGEEKKSSLFDKLKEFLLGGGLGAALKGVLGALLAAATGVIGVTGVAWNLFSGDERANKAHGAQLGANMLMRSTGLGNLKLNQLKSFFTDSSARETLVKDAAESASESGTKSATKGAKNLLRTSKFLDFTDLVRDTGKLTEATAAQTAKNAAFKEKGVLYRAFHPKETIKNLKDNVRIKSASALNTVLGKRAGSATSKAAASAVKTGAEEASESSIKRAVQEGVETVVNKLLNNSVVAKMASAFKGKFSTITKTIAKKIADSSVGNSVKNLAAKTTATALKGTARLFPLVNVGFAIVDFISGWRNTNKYFNIASSQVTTGMKFTSAIINTLVGLTSAIPVVGIFASLGLSFVQESLVQTIYKIIAGNDAATELQQKQTEMQTTLQQYKEQTGNELTQEQYELLFNDDGSEKKWYQRGLLGNIKAAWTKYKLKSGSYSTSDAGTTGSGRGLVTPMSQKSSQYNRGSRVMADAGCGPTSAAMVASAYGMKLNPEKLSKESFGMGMRASDGGMNPSYFSAMSNRYGKGFGMREGPVDGNLIQSNLAKNQPVIMMGKGGPFGSSMHYMVAESNGGKGKVNVVDPSNGARKSVKGSDLFRNSATSIYSWGRGSTSTATGKPDLGTEGLTDKLIENGKYAVNVSQLSKLGHNEKPVEPTKTDVLKYVSNNSNVGFNEDYDPTDPMAKKYSSEISKLDRYHGQVMQKLTTNKKVRKKLFGKGRGLWGRGTSGNLLAGDINKADTKSSSKAKIEELQKMYITRHWTRHDGSGWGDWRNWPGTGRYHAGIDLCLNSGKEGAAIKSFTEGTVTVVNNTLGARGKYVMVKDQYGYQHIYQHLSKTSVSVGQSVGIGDTLGGYGGSGTDNLHAYGLHLHYEIAKPGVKAPGGYMYTKQLLTAYCVNPYDYLNSYAGGKVSANFSSDVVSDGSSSDSSSTDSSSTTVNGIEVDTSSPSGIALMTTLSNVFSTISDPFTKALNAILMNDSDEEEETTDSSSSDVSGISGASGDTTQNAQTIYNNLKKQGFPDTNIAGILGNWNHESGIDPTSIEGISDEKQQIGSKKSKASSDFNTYVTGTLKGKYGNKSVNWKAYLADGKYYPGIGLGQWTGPRAKALIDYANANGGKWYDLATQLKYMLDTDGKATWMKNWKTAEKSPEAAAKKFLTGWEGGSLSSSWVASTLDDRQSYARKWYNKLAGTTAGDTNQVKETSTNWVNQGKGRGLDPDSWEAGLGFDPSATWGSAEWGTGAATNLSSLQSSVAGISDKISSSLSAVKDNPTQAVQTIASNLATKIRNRTGNKTNNSTTDSDNLAMIVTLLSQNLSEILSTLKDIKTNTETSNSLIQSDTNWKKQTYQTSRADNYASSMSGNQPTNVGSTIVDRLTSK